MLVASNSDGIEVQDIDGETLTTEMPLSQLNNLHNRNIWKDSMNFLVQLEFRDTPTDSLNKEVFYNINSSEMVLNDYRVTPRQTGGDIQNAKNEMLIGLLVLLYQVSEGKIFNIPLNPLNFVIETTALNPREPKHVKGFYREDRELGEIDDNWLKGVYKLLAWYLVSSSSIDVTQYNQYDIGTIMEFFDSDQDRNNYITLIEQKSISKMLQMMLHDTYPVYYDILKTTPAWVPGLRHPKDLTTGAEPEMGLPAQHDVTLDNGNTPNGNGNINIDEAPVGDNQENRRAQKRGKGRQQRPVDDANNGGARPAKSSGGFMKTAIVGVLMLALGAVGGHWYATKNQPQTQIADIPENNRYFYDGLLNASIQQTNDAGKSYDTYFSKATAANKKAMTKKEKMSVFFTYLLGGEYNKALEHDNTNSSAELLVTYLKNKNTLKQGLDKVDSDLPAIQFEKAVLKQDWKTVASLQDKVSYTTNKPRQAEIAHALVETDDVESAVKLADNTNNKAVLSAIKTWGYDMISHRTESAKQKAADKLKFDKQVKNALGTASNLKTSDYPTKTK